LQAASNHIFFLKNDLDNLKFDQSEASLAVNPLEKDIKLLKIKLERNSETIRQLTSDSSSLKKI
jgi:hypothetical protein